MCALQKMTFGDAFCIVEHVLASITKFEHIASQLLYSDYLHSGYYEYKKKLDLEAFEFFI